MPLDASVIGAFLVIIPLKWEEIYDFLSRKIS